MDEAETTEDNIMKSKNIKLKNILSENTPGYKDRKFGAPLPTLEDIQNAHNAKQDLKEEYIEVMNMPELNKHMDAIAKLWKKWKYGPMTERSDIKPAAKELKDYLRSWFQDYIK